MAGEGLGPTFYEDIDIGKVINKVGLLELCSKIKQYIANNSSGGSGSSIKYIAYQPNINEYSAADLQAIYDFMMNPTTADPVVILYGSRSAGIVECHMMTITASSTYNKIYFGGFDTAGSTIIPYTTIMYRSTISNDTTITYQSIQTAPLFSGENVKVRPLGTATTLEQWLRYDAPAVTRTGSYNDLTDKPAAELPTIASGDEGKALVVNSTGTGVEWSTVSGGGTTYTAGTGISITNGVISLDIADVSEEEM